MVFNSYNGVCASLDKDRVNINMNQPVELPSGTIFNIDRFIALLPVAMVRNPREASATTHGYHLILEGYSLPINLEEKDADALKRLLKLDSDILVKFDRLSDERNEQLNENQRAIALLAKRRQRHQTMSREESIHREELFNEFKQVIDTERLAGQKLYSLS